MCDDREEVLQRVTQDEAKCKISWRSLGLLQQFEQCPSEEGLYLVFGLRGILCPVMWHCPEARETRLSKSNRES